MTDIYITKRSQTQRDPVFLEILEEAKGGVMIECDARIPTGIYTLFAGCPVATCATQGQYMFIKTAQVATAKADGATRIVIEAPNVFKVGDIIAVDGHGTASTATVTVVAPTYIVTALTNYTAAKKDVVYQCNADAATAPKYEPVGFLKNDTYVRDHDGTTLHNVPAGLVMRGSIAVSNYPLGYGDIVEGHLGEHFRFVDKGDV